MMEYFQSIAPVSFAGTESRGGLAFRYYNPEREVLGKSMREWLPFAMAWWHSLGAAGTDMFGGNTADKSFGTPADSMARAKAKVEAGFELMQKLGVDYFCFHDVDLVPEGRTVQETWDRLDEIAELIVQKMQQTGKKCLWGTANLFGAARYMNGAGSSNCVDVFCCAAAQIKKALDLTVRFGGRGYVFWGGREGYETLFNTDMRFEQENIAALMTMVRDDGRSIGFTGDFLIESKPKEPMKHQYDFDAATTIGFLRQYGLDRDFKLNIEANHATLAGHSFQHELRVSAMNGMLGSIDALMKLFVNGEEGVDYELADGQAKQLDGQYCQGNFVFGNNLLAYPLYGNGADFYQQAEQSNKAAECSPYLGFTLNTSDLELVMSQISAVTDQDKCSLQCGGYTKEAYAKYLSKLETAGVQDYLDAVQQQLDAWLAAR